VTRVTPRNLAGFARWAGWRLRYRNISGGLFFCGRGSVLDLAGAARLSVGRNFVALDGFHAVLTGDVRIGDNVFFNEGCHLSVVQGVRIGDGCLFGEKVSIHDEDHRFGAEYADVPLPERGMVAAAVVIGDNVWVGAKASILRGTTIGSGSVIAAHAVVTADVPPRSLAVGAPARIVRSW